MRKSLNANLNNENCSHSQSTQTNENLETNDKHKTDCLSNTTETREEDIRK